MVWVWLFVGFVICFSEVVGGLATVLIVLVTIHSFD